MSTVNSNCVRVPSTFPNFLSLNNKFDNWDLFWSNPLGISPAVSSRLAKLTFFFSLLEYSWLQGPDNLMNSLVAPLSFEGRFYYQFLSLTLRSDKDLVCEKNYDQIDEHSDRARRRDKTGMSKQRLPSRHQHGQLPKFPIPKSEKTLPGCNGNSLLRSNAC